LIFLCFPCYHATVNHKTLPGSLAAISTHDVLIV
jgi:hypothetical protein